MCINASRRVSSLNRCASAITCCNALVAAALPRIRRAPNSCIPAACGIRFSNQSHNILVATGACSSPPKAHERFEHITDSAHVQGLHPVYMVLAVSFAHDASVLGTLLEGCEQLLEEQGSFYLFSGDTMARANAAR